MECLGAVLLSVLQEIILVKLFSCWVYMEGRWCQNSKNKNKQRTSKILKDIQVQFCPGKKNIKKTNFFFWTPCVKKEELQQLFVIKLKLILRQNTESFN